MEIFKPTIQDQATFSGSVDISGSLTITQNLNVVGELQGAATTASYISLANVDGFADVSSSIEQRISRQELFSQSLDSTFATDQQVADAVSSLNAATSSYALQTDISGAFASTSQSLAGRITPLEGSVSSLNAATSSYALEANISGSFTSVSESLAGRITSNEGSVSALNSASSSYLLNTTDTLTGDLTITGKITAQEFHTEFVSASIIYESGSTKFGDSADDTHSFTGSVYVSNGITGTLTGNASTATSASYAATGPFLSSYTETDTLASVTGRGASTPTDISIANGQPKLRLKETDSTNVDKELLVSGGDFYIRNLNDNDTAGTNLLLVDSSGNLSATGRGQFAGALRVTETGTAQHILIGNQDSSGTNAPAMIRGVNAALQFGVGNSWVGEGGTMTVRMELKNDGNAYFTNRLGVGTTAPTARLDVRGTAGDGAELLRIESSGDVTNGGYHWMTSAMASSQTTNANMIHLIGVAESTRNSGYFGFHYAGAGSTSNYLTLGGYAADNLMIIKMDGNVGIGTTSPAAKLHVELDNSGGATRQELARFGQEGQNNISFYAYGGSTDVIQFGAWNSEQHISIVTDAQASLSATNTKGIFIQSGGNVGIGDTSPSYRLDVAGDVSFQTAGVKFIGGVSYNENIRMSPGSNDYSSLILGAVAGDSGTGAGQWTLVRYPTATYSNKFTIRHNSTDHFTIETGGNVGIGTFTPIAKLHIADGSYFPANNVIQGSSKLVLSGEDGNMDLLSYDDNSSVSNAIGFGRFNSSTGALIHKFGIVSWANQGSQGSNTGNRLAFTYGTSNDSWSNSELVSITSAGHVGVGNTSPTTFSGYKTLHIGNGATGGRGIVKLGTGTTANGPEIYAAPGTTTGNRLYFNTDSSTNVMVMDGSAVGIGTDTPGERLDIRGNTRIIAQGDTTGLILDTANATWANRLRFKNGGTDYWSFDARGTGEGSDFKFYRYNGSWDAVMTLDWANGYVGIQTESPGYTLQVNGSFGATSITETSALRFKENIVPLESQLENINKLNPVTFDWKEDNKHDIGFIAEEVEEVLPDLVSYVDDEVQGLHYTKFTAVLVKAIQEQQAQIQALKEEINKLKK